MADAKLEEFVSMSDLIARDSWVKNGPELNDESRDLKDIYMGQSREMTRTWLKALGQGDSSNMKPFQSKLLKRFVHTAAVVWSNSPTRRLTLDGVSLADSAPDADLVSRIYQRSRINSYLKAADRWRTLLGQAILYLTPPVEGRGERIGLRVFWPHAVMRDPDDTAQDDITQDRRIAFEVFHDPRTVAKSIWHYWEQISPGQWNAWRVHQDGSLVDGDRDGIYPNGVVPFEGCPFLVVYDELPEGRAWIPIDGTRTAVGLATNVVMNDLLYLLKQEAHSVIGVTGVGNQADMPKKWGPGEMWGFEEADARVHLLALNPKLAESIAVSRHLLEMFASGEGLPGDYFLASRKYETGAAGRLRQQDLDARRQDQVQDAVETENELFDLVRNLWNTFPEEGEKRIDEDVSLQVELGRQWFPTDLVQLQQTYAFDLSIGACSIVDYLMERYRITREQAIDFYGRVQVDRETYVLRENPAALIAGRNNSGDPGSSSLNGRPPEGDDVEPDASSMNPNRAASNEKGSTVGAAQKALEIGSGGRSN